MNKLLLSSLAALALVPMYTLTPAGADTIETTTVTQPSTAPATVVDSWMQPKVSRTKSVTTSDGVTEKTVEPLIMERHERVVVPTEEKVTTTTSVSPATVTEQVKTVEAVPVVTKKKVYRARRTAYRPKKVKRVAVRSYRPKTVAVNTVEKTVVVEPQVVQQKQTIERNSVVIDRPDPALNLP